MLSPENGAVTEQLRTLRVAWRQQRLEALIEKGAFEKRRESADGRGGGGDSDAAGGGPGSAEGGARRGKQKSDEEVRYATRVRAWHGAAKGGDVIAMRAALDESPWLLANRSENTAGKCHLHPHGTVGPAARVRARCVYAAESALGNTALHWAAANGRRDAVAWLLEQVPPSQVIALHIPHAHVCAWRSRVST